MGLTRLLWYDLSYFHISRQHLLFKCIAALRSLGTKVRSASELVNVQKACAQKTAPPHASWNADKFKSNSCFVSFQQGVRRIENTHALYCSKNLSFPLCFLRAFSSSSFLWLHLIRSITCSISRHRCPLLLTRYANRLHSSSHSSNTEHLISIRRTSPLKHPILFCFGRKESYGMYA